MYKKYGFKGLLSSKKAQVTVFIIVGIIILFVISFAVYIKSSASQVRPPIEQLEVTDELKPLQNYVTACLMQVSKEGLIRIGNTGGFIDVSGMKISPLPYDSDVYLFEPLMMPYWHYASDCPENSLGCIKSREPPLCRQGVVCALPSNGDNSIEEQLSRYVESNIGSCINDFAAFKGLLDIRAGKKIKVETIVREETVDFKMAYPLDVTVLASNKKAKVPYFVASHDVKLKKLYEYAQEIMLTESESKFLEVFTMNLITIYSGLDNNLLPPMRDMEIMSTNKKFWTRTNVKSMIKEEVLPYLNYVRFVNAENYAPMISFDDSNYSIYANGIYKSLEIKTSNNTYDLDARLIYTYPEIYFDIAGSEIIKPEKFKMDESPLMKMLGILITYYDFGYDVSFPVIIQLRDNSAFGGEGYSFSYSMEANIKDNRPLSGNLTLINMASGENTIDMTLEDQMPERIITLSAYDKHTHAPLEGVNLYYRCGREYELGQTIIKDGLAVWSGRMPYCEFGGELLYMKYGYMGAGIDLNNPEGEDSKDIKLELWPVQEKDVVVYKRTPDNVNNIINYGAGSIALFSSEKESLTELDKAFVTLNKIKQDYREDDVPMVGFMLYQPKSNITLNTSQFLDIISQSMPESVSQDILLEYRQVLMENPNIAPNIEDKKYSFALVPGQYKYDITMIYGSNILIPAKKDTICVGKKIAGICIGQEKDIDYPEQNLTEWVSGGASGIFTLTENDVYSDKKLALYVLEMPLPHDWESLANYKTPEQYQKGRTFLSRPRFE